MTNELIKSRYSIESDLGKGNWGTVHKVYDRLSETSLALKIIEKEKYTQPFIIELIQSEINVLSMLDHPNIIKRIDSFIQDPRIYIVYEYCNGGDIQQKIDRTGPLSEFEALQRIESVVEVLCYLKSQNIVHRDLKPENLLLHNNILKVADFGFATTMAIMTQGLKVGSLAFLAPETIERVRYSFKTDLYSAGVVLFNFLFGKLPYSKEDIPTILEIKKKCCLPAYLLNKVSRGTCDLLYSMLEGDESKRISPEEALIKISETKNSLRNRKETPINLPPSFNSIGNLNDNYVYSLNNISQAQSPNDNSLSKGDLNSIMSRRVVIEKSANIRASSSSARPNDRSTSMGSSRFLNIKPQPRNVLVARPVEVMRANLDHYLALGMRYRRNREPVQQESKKTSISFGGYFSSNSN